MPATYAPIASTTLDAATSSVTLGSGGTLPQTYTDLVLIMSVGCTVGANVFLRVNGDSGANYSYTRLYGDGSSAGSDRTSNNNITYVASRTASLMPAQAVIMSYSNTNVNKTILTSDAGSHSGGSVQRVVNLWRSTSAITSITILPSTGSLLSGSTFSLYGIKAA